MINVVVLAAGPNDEFSEDGYRFPKNLVEIEGIPLLGRVIATTTTIAGDLRVIVCISQQEDREFHTSETIRLVAPDAQIIHVKEQTAGALCTALLAVDLLSDEDELLIINGDSLVLQDLDGILNNFRNRNLDAGTVCFRAIHPRFSFVRLAENFRITEVAEKRPISQFATAGVYWFKSAHDFKLSAFNSIRRRQDVDGKFYVSPVLNELILARANVGAIEIDSSRYANLQSPKMIEDFKQKVSNRKRETIEYG
jgi:NDP-sugar pyrophosphorylase family protein